jgi:hypothetical protein
VGKNTLFVYCDIWYLLSASSDIRMVKDEMGMACSMHRMEVNSAQNLFGKPESKRLLVIPRHG